MKNKFKNTIRFLHRWLGMLSGLVVLVVALTGGAYVFKDEIIALRQPNLMFAAQKQPLLSPTEARAAARQAVGQRYAYNVVYPHPNTQKVKAIEVEFFERRPRYYASVFLHPYQGQVLWVQRHHYPFFSFLLRGHIRLWMPYRIGGQIVKWGTMVFAVVLLSGLLLWWPRSIKNAKRKLLLLWKKTSTTNRKNYDLHVVVGFYALVPAFLIAITGLMLGFYWFTEGFYGISGGQKSLDYSTPEATISPADTLPPKAQPIDLLMPVLFDAYPKATAFEVDFNENNFETIAVMVYKHPIKRYNADYLFYNPTTLTPISPDNTIYDAYKNLTLPDKLIRMRYDVHVGSVAGLGGKIIAFLCCIIIASLPLTGFLMFVWRIRSQRRARPVTGQDNRFI